MQVSPAGEQSRHSLALVLVSYAPLFGLVRTASRRLVIMSGLDIVSGILFDAMALRKALWHCAEQVDCPEVW